MVELVVVSQDTSRLNQAVDMNKGGKIKPHYDASIAGYINYKCNICVLSHDYDIYIGDEYSNIKQKDLYCFEASLYKHWTNEFNSRRIFLSFGFVVPYSVMNININDPRVRLSNRINKYFQTKYGTKN
jgi:aspartyl/asparaginyl beta-hydroxylase (cupin superfamily)